MTSPSISPSIPYSTNTQVNGEFSSLPKDPPLSVHSPQKAPKTAFALCERATDQFLKDLKSKDFIDKHCQLLKPWKISTNLIGITQLLSQKIVFLNYSKTSDLQFSLIELFLYLLEKEKENPSRNLKDIELIGENVFPLLFDITNITKKLPTTSFNTNKLRFRLQIPFTSLESFFDFKNLFVEFIAEKVRKKDPQISLESIKEQIESTNFAHFDIPPVLFCENSYATFSINDQGLEKKSYDFIISQKCGETTPFQNEVAISLKEIIQLTNTDLTSRIKAGTFSQTIFKNTPQEISQACLDHITGSLRLSKPLHQSHQLSAWLDVMLGYVQGKRLLEPDQIKELLETSFEAISKIYVMPQELQHKIHTLPADAEFSAWEIVTAYYLNKLVNNNFNTAIALLTQSSIALQQNGHAEHIAPLWCAMQPYLQAIAPKAVEKHEKTETVWSAINELMSENVEDFDSLLALLEVNTFLSLCQKTAHENSARPSASLNTSLYISEGKPAFKIDDGTYHLCLPANPLSAHQRLFTKLATLDSQPLFQKIHLMMNSELIFSGNGTSPISRNKDTLNFNYKDIVNLLSTSMNEPLSSHWKQLILKGICACRSVDETSISWQSAQALLDQAVEKEPPNPKEQQRFLFDALNCFNTNKNKVLDSQTIDLFSADLSMENMDPKNPDIAVYQAYKKWEAHHANHKPEKTNANELELIKKIAAYRPDLAENMLQTLKSKALLDVHSYSTLIKNCITTLCKKWQKTSLTLPIKSPLTVIDLCEQLLKIKENNLIDADFIELVTSLIFHYPLHTTTLSCHIAQFDFMHGKSEKASTLLNKHFAKLISQDTLDTIQQLSQNLSTIINPNSALHRDSDLFIPHQYLLWLKECEKLDPNKAKSIKKLLHEGVLNTLPASKDLFERIYKEELKLQSLPHLSVFMQGLLEYTTQSSAASKNLETLLNLRQSFQNATQHQDLMSFDQDLMEAVFANNGGIQNLSTLTLSFCKFATSTKNPELLEKTILAATKIKPSPEEKSTIKDPILPTLDKPTLISEETWLNIASGLLSKPHLEVIINSYPKETFSALAHLIKVWGSHEKASEFTSTLLRISLNLCQKFRPSDSDFQALIPLTSLCMEKGLSKTLRDLIKHFSHSLRNAISSNNVNLRHRQILSDYLDRVCPLPQQEIEKKTPVASEQEPSIDTEAGMRALIQKVFNASPLKLTSLSSIASLILDPTKKNITKARLALFRLAIGEIASPQNNSETIVLTCTKNLLDLATEKAPLVSEDLFSVASQLWLATKTALLTDHKKDEIRASGEDNQTNTDVSIVSTEKFTAIIEIILLGMNNSNIDFHKSMEQLAHIIKQADANFLIEALNSHVLVLLDRLPEKRLQQCYKILIDSSIPRIKQAVTTSKVAPIGFPATLLQSLTKGLSFTEVIKLCEEFKEIGTVSSLECSLAIAAGLLNVTKTKNAPDLSKMFDELFVSASQFPIELKNFIKECLLASGEWLPNNKKNFYWMALLQLCNNKYASLKSDHADLTEKVSSFLDFIIDNPLILKPYSPDLINVYWRLISEVLAYLCLHEDTFPNEKIEKCRQFLLSKPLNSSNYPPARFYLALLDKLFCLTLYTPDHLSKIFPIATKISNFFITEPSDKPERILKIESSLKVLFDYLIGGNYFDSGFGTEQPEAVYNKFKADMHTWILHLKTNFSSKQKSTLHLPTLIKLFFNEKIDLLKRENFLSELQTYKNCLKDNYHDCKKNDILIGFASFKRIADLSANAISNELFVDRFDIKLDLIKFLMDMSVDYAENELLFKQMIDTILPLLREEGALSEAEQKALSDAILDWCKKLVLLNSKETLGAAEKIFAYADQNRLIEDTEAQNRENVLSPTLDTSPNERKQQPLNAETIAAMIRCEPKSPIEIKDFEDDLKTLRDRVATSTDKSSSSLEALEQELKDLLGNEPPPVRPFEDFEIQLQELLGLMETESTTDTNFK